MSVQINHSCDDGIERIEYRPRNQTFQTPIFLQHGMFHSAQCWHGAEYWVLPNTGHNIMMERAYRSTILQIHQWLQGKRIT